MINVELIEKLIEKHGINWSILARSIGVTRQSMDYVKKQRKTSHETLQKIAEYFSIDLKTLLSANTDDNTTLITTDMTADEKMYKEIIRTYQEKVQILEEELAKYKAADNKKKRPYSIADQ